MLRSLVLSSILILFHANVTAQAVDSSQIKIQLENTKKIISDFQMRLDTSNYTRIPNKDFDSIVEHKIFNGMAIWISAVFFILSAAGYYSIKYFVSTSVDESVKEKFEEYKRKANERNDEFKKEITNDYTLEIKKISNELESNHKKLEDYRNQLLDSEEREKILENKKDGFLFIIRYESLKSKYDKVVSKNGIIKDDYFEKDLNEFIEDVSEYSTRINNTEHKITERLIDTIDMLIIYLYKLRRDEDLVKLVNEYENKNLISLISYTNFVQVQFNRYFNTIDENTLDRFLESLRVLEKKDPSYGAAPALRLQIFMKEYEIAGKDKSKKTDIRNNIDKVINRVTLSHNSILAYETIDLLLDYHKQDSIGIFANNIDELYKLVPNEMKKMIERGIMDLAIQYPLKEKDSYYKEKLLEFKSLITYIDNLNTTDLKGNLILNESKI